MRIYNYHPNTSEFLSSGEADQDPLDENNWLIPAYATTIEPPSQVVEGKAIAFSQGAWIYLEDNRGVPYWDEEGELYKMRTLGPLPEGVSLTEPVEESEEEEEKEEPTMEELGQDKRYEIDTGLSERKNAGMEYTMPDGTVEVIQTRSQDETNLLTLAMTARDLKAAGITDAVQSLRVESNKTYSLTPDQMIAATNAISALNFSLMTKAWALKDSITEAVENNDLEALNAITWV